MPPKRARATQGKKAQQKKRPSGASRKNVGGKKRAAAKVSDADVVTAFRLFAIDREELDEDADVGDDSEDEDDGDGVMAIKDVRKCLTSLKLSKPPPDFFPASQTHISSNHFLLLAQALRDSGDGDNSDAYSEEEEGPDEEDTEEASAAFALFTHNRSVDAPETRITLADLQRVARELREDVDEKVLKMMLEDANGGDASKGVSMDEFTDIMKRAGMLS